MATTFYEVCPHTGRKIVTRRVGDVRDTEKAMDRLRESRKPSRRGGVPMTQGGGESGTIPDWL